jgi:hypothetical protein
MLTQGFTAQRVRTSQSARNWCSLFSAPIVFALSFAMPEASATPYFAQKTGQHCSFCHNGAPTSNGANELNANGWAYKNNGYSFSQGQQNMPQGQQNFQQQQQPLCSMQFMPLFDRAGNFRGNFNVRVCN